MFDGRFGVVGVVRCSTVVVVVPGRTILLDSLTINSESQDRGHLTEGSTDLQNKFEEKFSMIVQMDSINDAWKYLLHQYSEP